MAVHNAQLVDDVNNLDRTYRIAIILSDFNEGITHLHAATTKSFLESQGFNEIDIFRVPGVLELPAITKLVTDKGIYDLCIIHGCVIQGDTPHFDFVCKSSIDKLTELSLHCQTPLIIGILTCNTLEQAKKRVDENYAIYGLNYLVQWLSAENIIETRYNDIMESVGSALDTLDSKNDS